MYVKEVAELKMVNEIKTVSTYKQNKQVQFDAMRTRKDLWKSQLSCQQMDTLKVQFHWTGLLTVHNTRE